MKLKLFLIAALISAVTLHGEVRMTRQEYIDKYSGIAVKQMKRSGIPASITLAQGCLESGDGNSTLAREANNHFGIKCHDWKGRTFHKDDDAKNECFRKYSDAFESYRDHSEFLRTRSRYAFLFDLEPTDYKGWAYGLKKAGYATAPDYAQRLIKIIEEYKLYRFDSREEVISDVRLTPGKRSPLYRISLNRPIYSRNGVAFVIAESYDTYGSIADEFNLFPREILRFNDLRKDEPLVAGQVVYVQRKKNTAAGVSMHEVGQDETMRDISQRYAVRLSKLYKYNKVRKGRNPDPGSIVFLRPVRNSWKQSER